MNADKLVDIKERIELALARAGRPSGSVTLLAVSKTFDPATVRKVYDCGQLDFGENYVQEALAKADRLPADIRWHMIGHLQSNKAARAAETFVMVHSVDRKSLAAELNKGATKLGRKLDVLLQVNTGGEASKSGADAGGTIELAKLAREWEGLRVRGLMAIPPYDPDPEHVRPHFRRLAELAREIDSLGLEKVEMTELSMGMSHDFEAAVEEGATIVRVGSAIFGERTGPRWAP